MAVKSDPRILRRIIIGEVALLSAEKHARTCGEAKTRHRGFQPARPEQRAQPVSRQDVASGRVAQNDRVDYGSTLEEPHDLVDLGTNDPATEDKLIALLVDVHGARIRDTCRCCSQYQHKCECGISRAHAYLKACRNIRGAPIR